MGTEMKEEKKGKVGILKFWTWNFRTMSAGIQAVLIGYIVFYCTDVLELNAALVATLLMASKIFDGVTDILAGYLVDKTHTRLGKARPYEFAIIGSQHGRYFLCQHLCQRWQSVFGSLWHILWHSQYLILY